MDDSSADDDCGLDRDAFEEGLARVEHAVLPDEPSLDNY